MKTFQKAQSKDDKLSELQERVDELHRELEEAQNAASESRSIERMREVELHAAEQALEAARAEAELGDVV